jgi:hypothetical protein
LAVIYIPAGILAVIADSYRKKHGAGDGQADIRDWIIGGILIVFIFAPMVLLSLISSIESFPN